MNLMKIGLNLGGFLGVRGFASKVTSPQNTTKSLSDDFLFCPLIIIEVLRLYNELDHDRIGFGWIRVV
jgi:hypothetical protein